MDSFPRSPRLLRGSIVQLDPSTGIPRQFIALQYNPDTITRSLQVKGGGQEGGDRSEVLRLKGPPIETIKLEAEIDATDQLGRSDAGETLEAGYGIHPQLAALETLIYPNIPKLIINKIAALSGSIEIFPTESALTVFVWSIKRILPVRITEFSITEEAFDSQLNPIRAKVSLGMRVLNIDDVTLQHPAGAMFMVHMASKEALSMAHRVRSIGTAANALAGLF